MDNNLDDFSTYQFNNELNALLGLFERKYVPTISNKKAFLLGGQSGAGKTTLHSILSELVTPRPAIINGDEYRKSHPNFVQLNAAYGKDAVSHTAAWSGKMTETLIDALSKLGYNLIIEGTLRTSSVPMKTAES